MPQATTLRLVGGPDARVRRSASAHAIIKAHMTHVNEIHTISTRLAADAELLLEALRYFTVRPAAAR